MGLFDKFKKKKYLKRTNFISLVDSNKIRSKSMTIPEIKCLLEKLKIEISKCEFDTDKNFIMNSRRKTLKRMIEERLQKNDGTINEFVSESLFNFWEFITDEYPGNIMSDCTELGISIKEYDTMDKSYREKGIICIQEREIILEIINLIINSINERDFIDADGRKIKEEKTINKTINEIEEKFKVKLPQEYIKYMENNNEYTGILNEQYYNIWKSEDIISMNNNYQVQELFPNLIYFGSNGGGEAFAFDKSNNMCIVSIPFIGTEKDKIIVANNFNDFMKK